MEKIATKTADKNTPPEVVDCRDMYTDLVNEMYRAFDFFNEHFCKEALLPRPIITVASKGTHKRALGWFSSKSWKDSKGRVYNEINICAEHMSRNVNDILETLLHEMAHLKNNFYGIKDVANRRHNKKFKAAAEFFGLQVAKPTNNLGWTYTSLDKEATAAIKKLKPDAKIFGAFRDLEKAPTKRGNLRPIMVSIETKDTVEYEASARGMSQRELTEAAIEYYLENFEEE